MKHVLAVLTLVSVLGISYTPAEAGNGNRGGGRSCATNNGGRYGGSNYGGRYNGSINGGGYRQATRCATPSPIGSRPFIRRAPAPVVAPVAPRSPLEEAFTDDAPLDHDVFVRHPVSNQFMKVKEFQTEVAAQKCVDNLGTRYWVTYQDAASNGLKFRAARDASRAQEIAEQLRGVGNTVASITPVVARLNDGADDGLLADLPDAPAPAPADEPTVEDEASPSDLPPGLEEDQVAETSPPASTSFLVGLWQAVARKGTGELTTIDLKLDGDGWATLTVPTKDGERTAVKRRVELKDGQLVLTEEGSADLNLGRLASFGKDRIVLNRPDGEVTFVRP